MKVEKPSIPKGTRDFGPDKMLKRQFILDKIRGVFETFGYLPLETPAMENLSVLQGKYGAEGDQLLYKMLNSGDFLSKVPVESLSDGSKALTPFIAEKGLRYDLTVPFARYVVMNQHEITFPFKRYQIQPVWRADRPQKGRYREFYQCDADVVGTNSLLCEAEIILMIEQVMERLGIEQYEIKVNNRKLLTAITEYIGAQGKESEFCVAIDKLDKIGKTKVEEELRQNGFEEASISKLEPIFDLKGSRVSLLSSLRELLAESEIGKEGISELEELFEYVKQFGSEAKTSKIDLTLARGLSYYTGTILEVSVINSSMKSSISGGGRYDNLTGVFGLPGISGVGFSFGVDRIYDVMDDLNLFPTEFASATQVLLLNFDAQSAKTAISVLSELRKLGVKSELYPDAAKIKKQMNYANRKQVPFVLMIGDNEVKEEKYQLKDMKSGEQRKLSLSELIDFFAV